MVKYKAGMVTAFAAGELTPALAGRVDMEGISFGSRLLKNFLPQVQGGLKKFYGTKHIKTLSSAEDSVLIPFDGADEPIVLFVHGQTVSVCTKEDYYDVDIKIGVGELKDLRWSQLNDIIFFAHPKSNPFTIRYEGRDPVSSKHVFTSSVLQLKEEPFFPINWGGNYNKTVESNGYKGTVQIKIRADASGTLELPGRLRNMSSSIYTPHPSPSVCLAYPCIVGDAKIQLLRKRAGVVSVVKTISTGSVVGVQVHGAKHSDKIYVASRILSRDQVMGAIRSILPSAEWKDGNTISYYEEPAGGEDGDEYGLRFIQDNSVSTSGISGTWYGNGTYWYPQAQIIGYTETGEFRPITTDRDDFTDKNVVGRRIKFLLQSTSVAVKVWARDSSYAKDEVVYSDGNYYRCVTGGTSGSIQPIHTSGTRTDGTIPWEYMHSGVGFATVSSVEDGSTLTAVVDGYLPVISLKDSNYYWNNYQWSMWGYKNSYPTQVFFFKNRLGYIFPSKGYGCWLQLSKTDDYYDFGTETRGKVLDTDGINIVIFGHADNNVNWILAGERMYCGSSSGEYVVSSFNNGPITPSNISISAVSATGGANIPALKYMDLNMFVGNNDNGIFNIEYDYTREDYFPENIGLLSTHLLNKRIKRWAEFKNYDRVVFARTADGDTFVISYIKEFNKLLAYYRLDLDGFVSDIACSSSGLENMMLFLVLRDGKFYLERADHENPQYMICREEVFDNKTPLNELVFDQHKGKDIYIKNLDTGEFVYARNSGEGKIDVEYNWENFTYGLPMESVLHGAPVVQEEKLEGFRQQSVKFIVRLLDSGAFSYGASTDFEKWYDYNKWSTLQGQSWDKAHRFVTGDITLPASFGYMQGLNVAAGPYPNTSGIAMNIKCSTPEPFNILMISYLYV